MSNTPKQIRWHLNIRKMKENTSMKETNITFQIRFFCYFCFLFLVKTLDICALQEACWCCLQFLCKKDIFNFEHRDFKISFMLKFPLPLLKINLKDNFLVSQEVIKETCLSILKFCSWQIIFYFKKIHSKYLFNNGKFEIFLARIQTMLEGKSLSPSFKKIVNLPTLTASLVSMVNGVATDPPWPCWATSIRALLLGSSAAVETAEAAAAAAAAAWATDGPFPAVWGGSEPAAWSACRLEWRPCAAAASRK
jgi:hypothetical protein